MLSADDAAQIVGAGVVALVTVCLTIAWIPARGRYPGGLPSRVFISVGLVAIIWEPAGLGVIGLVLAAMGLAVWWSGQPEPELPRPRRVGFVVSSLFFGALTYAVIRGWWVFGAMSEEVRLIASVFAAGTGLLGTLAIADRARVTYRDALRRHFRPPPTAAPPP
ncbi:hypothetical protein [Phytoactinopolyspora halotolerans]|uniref:Uncharacterized protein n=1 Tax=Phytoactinopolyspora halotolerans TaxID=1981512 RepID=A0A6L9SB06_9ACTN|nr:hypothetical protein [Phytoactinopolyspora halotolerans]NEE01741.1 hypothetical protein [Phytoactinopolyspora halotolerans]